MRCTIRANLIDLPTDCPQRDERMGWMDYHEQLFQDIRSAFQRKFVGAEGVLGTGSQGGYVLGLAYDLLEGQQIGQAADHLVAASMPGAAISPPAW
jgi:hypothetical protein